MVSKRIIPCLDVREGKTVKGINFEGLREVGDPVEMGIRYAAQGADELVYLDISATTEGRGTFMELVSRIAKNINIPFTVGGGIRTKDQAAELLLAGADKISVNSAAVENPDIITSIASKYGSQFVVAAIDAVYADGSWRVVTHSGTKTTELGLFEWVKKVEELGAGEILFTSVNHDGTGKGFACDELKAISELVSIPLIASGGAGKKEDFLELFSRDCADGALASSLFHFGKISIYELKNFLKTNGVDIRI
ncbi:MAG: imidazole glycerol phosphate synthase subunit HisF [Bacteroidales bacterium]|nr:imidazole glycerol phosphate synthase subunit HisF [Bacteroidales bacterium]MDD2425889.1 imidazole glycerol phosphate synthase subunit HisF [Bacteroidales bacterium]MDD3990155.1 imidazole glycerol phosphate synthase subunit HisF [Bacteroidales bacterium]MDD4639698.1 imidazole glycerol phosphate synthase subunit HisF [Bacteroidales bacterium]